MFQEFKIIIFFLSNFFRTSAKTHIFFTAFFEKNEILTTSNIDFTTVTLIYTNILFCLTKIT